MAETEQIIWTDLHEDPDLDFIDDNYISDNWYNAVSDFWYKKYPKFSLFIVHSFEYMYRVVGYFKKITISYRYTTFKEEHKFVERNYELTVEFDEITVITPKKLLDILYNDDGLKFSLYDGYFCGFTYFPKEKKFAINID